MRREKILIAWAMEAHADIVRTSAVIKRGATTVVPRKILNVAWEKLSDTSIFLCIDVMSKVG